MTPKKVLGSFVGIIRSRTRDWMRPAVAIPVVVFAAIVAAGVVLGLRVSSVEKLDTQRAQAMEVSKEAVAEVLTYGHGELDAEREQVRELVTAEFAGDLDTLMSDVVGPRVREQKAVVKTRVTSSSVIDAEPNTVRLLVLLAQESTDAERDAPVITNAAARVEMRAVEGRWLIAAMEPL